MPFDAMALASAITISALTVFEKLFHDDQPIGGGGIGMGRAACVCAADTPADRTAAIVAKINADRFRVPILSTSHLEEDFLSVQNPHGNKAERGERDRIGERGPAGIGDVRKRVQEYPADQ